MKMMYSEKELDKLNQEELRELYMELWLAAKYKESAKVFNYIAENFPYLLTEGF
jgi:hypothetical protein